MHFEVLVEDLSGSITLEFILEKILGENYGENTWRLHPYKGIGRIPKNLGGVTEPANRILLDRLPSVLQGYGNSLDESAAVIIVIDLDDKNCVDFKGELLDVLQACNPRPKALFRIAIEETESWLLGDSGAVKAGYPNVKNAVLNNYVQDSIWAHRKLSRMLSIQEGLPGSKWQGTPMWE